MVRTGCQWRNLPPCYPPWRAVNYYFEQWTHSAGEHDGAAACPLIEACSAIRQRLPKILGDGAYANTFAQNAEKARIEPERASKPEAVKGFVPIPKRWVVERTIAWTNFFRIGQGLRIHCIVCRIVGAVGKDNAYVATTFNKKSSLITFPNML